MGITDALLRLPPFASVRRLTAPIWDYPLTSLTPREIITPKLDRSETGAKIPKLVTQTWELNEFGRRHGVGLKALRQLNPGFEFRLLVREDRDEFVFQTASKALRELYFASKFEPMKVDIFRYLYVNHHGGYYLDISKAWTTPINELASSSSEGLIAFERNRAIFLPPSGAFGKLRQPLNLVCMWGFGFTPNHPILNYTLDYILESAPSFRGLVLDVPKNGIVSLTGPVAFTHGVWRYLSDYSGENLSQWPNDYEGNSWTIPGAGFRHIQRQSYASARNASLFD